MRTVCALVPVMLGASACVANASAQETGSLIQHRAAQIHGRGPNAARVTMEGFAACMVDRSEGRARKLVGLPVDSTVYGATLKSMFDSAGDECMADGMLTMTGKLLQGSMFVALYKRDFKAEKTSAFSADVDSGYRALYGDRPTGEAYSALALEQFGECVSRADPENARSLTLSIPSSKQESNAVAGLMPKFSACIPEGERIELSKASVKGAIAEGLYRLTLASRNGPVARVEIK